MDTLIIMLKNVIIFVLLAVPGYLLVKGKILESKGSAPMSGLLTYVGMPFLILSSTLKLEFSGEFTRALLFAGGMGIVFTVLMFFAAAFLTRRETEEKRRAMMRFCMVFANNGFIGIPLARAVFGEGSPVMAYLIVLNIITNVLMFTLGVYLISGDKRIVNMKKAVLNPVLIAFLVGIALNLAKVTEILPEVQTYATHFSNIVTPLSMVILGMKLAQLPFGRLFGQWRMYYVSAVRLVIFPVLGAAAMLLMRKIPGLPIGKEMVIAFFIALSVPTAGLASVFSDQYHGDTENAVTFTLGTTILSVATIPVLYWLLGMMI